MPAKAWYDDAGANDTADTGGGVLDAIAGMRSSKIAGPKKNYGKALTITLSVGQDGGEPTIQGVTSSIDGAPPEEYEGPGETDVSEPLENEPQTEAQGPAYESEAASPFGEASKPKPKPKPSPEGFDFLKTIGSRG